MRPKLHFKLPIDHIIQALLISTGSSYTKGISNSITTSEFQPLDSFMRFVYMIVMNGPFQELEKVQSTDGTIELLSDSENILSDGWEIIAPFWPAIETPANYFLTMAALLHYLKQEKVQSGQWLSIGSGPGIYETYLAKYFPTTHITSLDSASGMTSFHKKLQDKYSHNQTILLQDMGKFKSERGLYDLIICNNSLQWAEKKSVERLAPKLYESLKKKAHLFLIVHPHKMQMHARETDMNIVKNETKDLDGGEVLAIFEKAGFTKMAMRLMSSSGAGQLGGDTSRQFFHFKKR
jgi:protein-L-isoaspartate O-methyltransferase